MGLFLFPKTAVLRLQCYIFAKKNLTKQMYIPVVLSLPAAWQVISTFPGIPSDYSILTSTNEKHTEIA